MSQVEKEEFFTKYRQQRKLYLRTQGLTLDQQAQLESMGLEKEQLQQMTSCQLKELLTKITKPKKKEVN